MNTMEAFQRGQHTKHLEPKVFDWEKAARLIRERGSESADAGLVEDWNETCAEILDAGNPTDSPGGYLASTWATPVLITDDGSVTECWRPMSETPGWHASTWWPQEALAILAAGAEESDNSGG